MRSIGRNIKHLIDRPDEEYCFRLHKERVYYMSQSLCRRAAHAERSRPSHQLWLGRESSQTAGGRIHQKVGSHDMYLRLW
jgi:IS5 family transposase